MDIVNIPINHPLRIIPSELLCDIFQFLLYEENNKLRETARAWKATIENGNGRQFTWSDVPLCEPAARSKFSRER